MIKSSTNLVTVSPAFTDDDDGIVDMSNSQRTFSSSNDILRVVDVTGGRGTGPKLARELWTQHRRWKVGMTFPMLVLFGD
jgi:hypothetical protein